MKTDIPRIRKRLGGGKVLVYFPSGTTRVMRIDDYIFHMEHRGYY
jgi:hypothetical protein